MTPSPKMSREVNFNSLDDWFNKKTGQGYYMWGGQTIRQQKQIILASDLLNCFF